MTVRMPPPRLAHGATWLITFADLVALVLSFFVMIYATQRVEDGNWQAMVQSLSRSLRVESAPLQVPSAARNAELRHPVPALALTYLEALLDNLRMTEPALAGIVLHRLEDRLIIALPGDLLFHPGRADPVPGARTRIAVLANLLRNVSNRVDVFGHTDPSPVPDRIFASNWELSLARAQNVAALLRATGYPRPLGAFGLADTRFEDLAAINSPTRRLRLARRVDIVVRSARGTR